MAKVKVGDAVTWKSHGGTAKGKVEERITHDRKVAGHQVRASKDDPQFLVKTEDGKAAAHKPESLRKA